MFSTQLDRLGDWNPQLLRELKGRLKPRNVAFTILLILQPITFISKRPEEYWLPTDYWTDSAFTSIFLFNLAFFLCLIVALSPAWQTLQDWSRFRQMNQASARRGLLPDLALGEKSPALVAFGLNLAIAIGCLALWIMLNPITEKTLALWGLLAYAGLLMIYVCLSQTIMLTQLKQRGVWAAAAIAISTLLPMIMLAAFYEVPKVGLLAPIAAPWFLFIKGLPIAKPSLFSVLSQWGIVALLSLIYARQLHHMGQSAAQKILAGSGMMGGKQPSPQ